MPKIGVSEGCLSLSRILSLRWPMYLQIKVWSCRRNWLEMGQTEPISCGICGSAYFPKKSYFSHYGAITAQLIHIYDEFETFSDSTRSFRILRACRSFVQFRCQVHISALFFISKKGEHKYAYLKHLIYMTSSQQPIPQDRLVSSRHLWTSCSRV